MAVITLTSAFASPGVTTTSIGLAIAWPRPVLLVEADPTGASGVLAGFFRGAWSYQTGLVELALASSGVADALPTVVQRIGDTSVSFLAGTRSHTQATGLRGLWDSLITALAELESSGQDVIVDAGRLGVAGSPEPLIAGADLTLLLTRSSLASLAGTKSWAETAREPGIGWRQPGALLIGESKPYRTSEVSKVIGLPVVAALPDDPVAAAVYHDGAAPPARFETSAYARGMLAVVEAIQANIAHSRSQLVEDGLR